MDITEVRVKLMDFECEDRLLGFCSITIDDAFVVRDLKIIRGSKGAFVAMPSRKLTDRCSGCGGKNQLRASYCNHCGSELDDDRSFKQPDGKAKLYADIAHPIHSDCRDLIQEHVISAYEKELVLAKSPGYICRYDDFGEFDNGHDSETEQAASTPVVPTRNGNVRIDHPQSERKPHRIKEPYGRNETVTQHAQQSEEFGAGLF